MSPAIRIWGISGPLGMIVSGLITVIMVGVGTISAQGADPQCEGIGFGDCLGQIVGSALGEFIGTVILVLLVFLLFMFAAWFLTGMFAGWLAVRHIRRLEPGITSGQGVRVSASWGCGAVVAAVVTFFLIGILSALPFFPAQLPLILARNRMSADIALALRADHMLRNVAPRAANMPALAEHA